MDISSLKIPSSSGILNTLFENCTSLKYLNLEKATIDKDINWAKFFLNVPSDTIYCATDNTIINNFSGHMINNCSNACFKNNTKIILEKNICTSECNLDDIYKYEYNNFCYQKCPEDYYDLNNKCEKCYYKCKNCLRYGDDTNNKCSECIEDMILLNDTNKNKCYNKCNYFYYFDENGAYTCTNSLQCPGGYYNVSTEEVKKCVKKEKESLTSEIVNNIESITSEIEDNQESTNKKGIEAQDKGILDFLGNPFNIKEINESLAKGEDYKK